MFLLSTFSKVQRFGVQIPNVNLSTGIIGAVSVALFASGILCLRSKPSNTVVLVRNPRGTIGAILRTDHVAPYNKTGQSNPTRKSAIEAPKPRTHRKTKHVLEFVLVTAPIMGYVLMGLALSTFSPIMAICSQSMQPTFTPGDLIIIRGVQVENVEVGDIIAFHVPSPYDSLAGSPTVHRVVDKREENTQVYFTTKGDSNPSADAWHVPAENVIGEYAQFKVPYMGAVTLFLRTPLGVTCLAVMVASIFLYNHYRKKRNQVTCRLRGGIN